MPSFIDTLNAFSWSTQLMWRFALDLQVPEAYKLWVSAGQRQIPARCVSKDRGSLNLSLNSKTHLGIEANGAKFDIAFQGSLSNLDTAFPVLKFEAVGVTNTDSGSVGLSDPLGDHWAKYSLSATSAHGSFFVSLRPEEIGTGGTFDCAGNACSELVSTEAFGAANSLAIDMSAKMTSSFNPFGMFPDPDDFGVNIVGLSVNGGAGAPLAIEAEIHAPPVPECSVAQWMRVGKQGLFRARVNGLPPGAAPTYAWSIPSGNAHIVGSATALECSVQMDAAGPVVLRLDVTVGGLRLEAVCPFTVVSDTEPNYQGLLCRLVHYHQFKRIPYQPDGPPFQRPAASALREHLVAVRNTSEQLTQEADRALKTLDARHGR